MGQTRGVSLMDRNCLCRDLSFMGSLQTWQVPLGAPWAISRGGSSVLLIDGDETKYSVCSFGGLPHAHPEIWDVTRGAAAIPGTGVSFCRNIPCWLRGEVHSQAWNSPKRSNGSDLAHKEASNCDKITVCLPLHLLLVFGEEALMFIPLTSAWPGLG